MKNFGFTLAEVLVTLGIIGVVAALTVPNLKINTANAQIGPALGKAVSVFEQANEVMLDEKGCDSISKCGFANAGDYIEDLVDYIKSSIAGNITSVYDGVTYTGLRAKDGAMYLVGFANPIPAPVDRMHPNRNYIGTVQIDINGTSDPNAVGEDHFVFGLFDDGSLRPKGHADWNGGNNGTIWQDTCKVKQIPTHPEDCTAHIFDNNMKALYK